MGCCCQGVQLEDPAPFAGIPNQSEIPGNLCVPMAGSEEPLGQRQEESRVVLEQDRPCWWHLRALSEGICIF